MHTVTYICVCIYIYRSLAAHDGCVNTVAWRPDGAFLASGSVIIIVIIIIIIGLSVCFITHTIIIVVCLVVVVVVVVVVAKFIVLLGSDDTTVCLWDYSKGLSLAGRLLTGHEANIFCVRLLEIQIV